MVMAGGKTAGHFFEQKETGLPSATKRPSSDMGDVMDQDTRELITHLFAEITARLENATEIASAGQSPQASARQYRTYAKNLARTADELGYLAHATKTIISAQR